MAGSTGGGKLRSGRQLRRVPSPSCRPTKPWPAIHERHSSIASSAVLRRCRFAMRRRPKQLWAHCPSESSCDTRRSQPDNASCVASRDFPDDVRDESSLLDRRLRNCSSTTDPVMTVNRRLKGPSSGAASIRINDAPYDLKGNARCSQTFIKPRLGLGSCSGRRSLEDPRPWGFRVNRLNDLQGRHALDHDPARVQADRTRHRDLPTLAVLAEQRRRTCSATDEAGPHRATARRRCVASPHRHAHCDCRACSRPRRSSGCGSRRTGTCTKPIERAAS